MLKKLTRRGSGKRGTASLSRQPHVNGFGQKHRPESYERDRRGIDVERNRTAPMAEKVASKRSARYQKAKVNEGQSVAVDAQFWSGKSSKRTAKQKAVGTSLLQNCSATPWTPDAVQKHNDQMLKNGNRRESSVLYMAHILNSQYAEGTSINTYLSKNINLLFALL